MYQNSTLNTYAVGHIEAVQWLIVRNIVHSMSSLCLVGDIATSCLVNMYSVSRVNHTLSRFKLGCDGKGFLFFFQIAVTPYTS